MNSTENQTQTKETVEQELKRLKAAQSTTPPVDAIPQLLKNIPQWILWRYEIVNGKVSKPPKMRSGSLIVNASTTEPKTWKPFTTAVNDMDHHNQNFVAMKTDKIDGLGFVFTKQNGLVGIDLDDSVENGILKPWAKEIVDSMPNTYWEFSPSGTGVKGIIKAVKKESACSKHYADGKVEIFNDGRYFTITGKTLAGIKPVISDTYQSVFDDFYAKVFNAKPVEKPIEKVIDIPTSTGKEMVKMATIPTPPVDALTGDKVWQTGNHTDDEIIAIAKKSKHGEKFQRLLNGDITGYTGKGGEPDHSGADLAFMNALAVFTNKNQAQMERIFTNSKLFRGTEKGADYVSRTIEKACQDTTITYGTSTIIYNEETSDKPTYVCSNGMIVANCYRNTDMGNAKRFILYHGDNVRYVKDIGWYVWNGKVWEQNNEAIIRLAQATVKIIHYEREACDAQNVSFIDLAKWAKASEANAKIMSMLETARVHEKIFIKVEALDQDRYLLSVANGTLDLRTGVLREHRREDLITKLSPVTYDPDATCPTFDAFMEQISQNNPTLVDYVLMVLGYGLSGDTKHQHFWIFYGSGANGKSTLMNVCNYILGDYFHVASESLICGDKNEHSAVLATLQGRRIVCVSETEVGAKMKDSLVKRLSGEEKITARFMNQNPFTFDRTHKIFMLTNNKPRIKDTSDGMWRRVQLVPFTVTIPQEKQDSGLTGKLKSEASGIFNRLLKGCVNALSCNQLTIPKVVLESTTQYQKESDPVSDFLNDKIETDTNGWIASSSLYAAYKTYAEANGGYVLSGRAFGDTMARLGYEPKVQKHQRGWQGIKIIVTGNESVYDGTKEVNNEDNSDENVFG